MVHMPSNALRCVRSALQDIPNLNAQQLAFPSLMPSQAGLVQFAY